MCTHNGDTEQHRMCGVWSPLISDRLDGYCSPSLVSLARFFFIGPYVSSASRRGTLICQHAICHCRDLMSPVKTRTQFSRLVANLFFEVRNSVYVPRIIDNCGYMVETNFRRSFAWTDILGWFISHFVVRYSIDLFSAITYYDVMGF